MEQQNLERILARARKLLAMSKDTSSPHEAEIAARRLRVLCEKYALTEEALDGDVAEPMPGSAEWIYCPKNARSGQWDRVIAAATAKIYRVSNAYGALSTGGRHVFYGDELRSHIARLVAEKVITDVAAAANAKFPRARRSGISDFRNGASAAIWVRSVELSKQTTITDPDTGTAVALVDSRERDERLARKYEEAHGIVLTSKATKPARLSEAAIEGYDYGMAVPLRPTVEG